MRAEWMLRETVRAEFLERAYRDLESQGRMRSLAEYEALFAEFQELIRTLYEDLRGITTRSGVPSEQPHRDRSALPAP